MIRIFVGCAGNNEDLESQSVLEWSIRKNTERPVEITWLQASRDPASPLFVWDMSEWTTPFSGFRWAVPELCGWQGRAIYLDSDIIVLADISELWDQPIPPGKVAIAKGGKHGQRFCVSAWDCAAAQAHLPAIETMRRQAGAHRNLMRYFAAHPELVEPFAGGDWNALDLEQPSIADPDVRALHYTGIPTQLQLRHALPRLAREGGRHWHPGPFRPHPMVTLQMLFDDLLGEAAAAGYGIERYRREPSGKYGLRKYGAR